MAIFGIGAYYDGDDVSEQFIEQNRACIGWPEPDAPPAHSILRRLQTGDIIFIKAFPPNVGLKIKAVGIVTGETVQEFCTLGICVPVRWIWEGEEYVGRLEDKYDPVRGVTIYEEHNPVVQNRIIGLILSNQIT